MDRPIGAKTISVTPCSQPATSLNAMAVCGVFYYTYRLLAVEVIQRNKELLVEPTK